MNISIIDTRPEIILLYLPGWLLCQHKNLSNLQLGCEEPKKYKSKNKNEKKAGEKLKELQNWYPSNISQDCKKSTQFLTKFPLGALAAAKPATLEKSAAVAGLVKPARLIDKDPELLRTATIAEFKFDYFLNLHP